MASTYTPIATTTLGSATATVTFSSIPSTYTDLVLVVQGAATTTLENIYIKYNNDTGSNYSYTLLLGTGSSAISARYSANTWGEMATGQSNNIYNIMNYANTTTYKTTLFRTNNLSDGTLAQVGLWRSTSAINRIDLTMGVSQTFIAGSQFTLYGITAA